MSQKIKIGARQSTPKNLSYSHYTTLGFGTPIPVCSYEVSPNSNFKIKPNVFARVAPMALPNLGNINMNLHAFYVPFRVVWKHFDDFISGKVSWQSDGQSYRLRSVPTLDNLILSYMFTDVDNGLADSVQNSEDADLIYVYGNQPTSYALTKKGKFVYHLLSSLGYKWRFVDYHDTSVTSSENQVFSALPLLCYFKCFFDRYIPSQLVPSSSLNALFEEVNSLGRNGMSLDSSHLSKMLDYVYLYHSRNYFTASWLYPNAPVYGLHEFNKLQTEGISLSSGDPYSSAQGEGQYVHSENNSTYTDFEGTNVDSGSIIPRITASGLTLIQKFNNFIKRLNYSGSRAIESLRSMFGVKAPELELQMSDYLGSYTIPLQKTDVTVTGNTAEAGEMVGKSWFSSDNHKTFSVKCDYHGMIFIIASIDVPSTFVGGVRRNLMHIKPFDFYNPDFDGTLLQAISGQEIESSFPLNTHDNEVAIKDSGLSPNSIFGFVPRYAEYQMPLDNVSGDFDLDRYGSNIRGFLLNREFYDKEYYREGVLHAPTTTFKDASHQVFDSNGKFNVLGSLNGSDMVQFNRIFSDTTGMTDPFFCVFHFDTLAHTPQIPIDEVAEIVGRGKELDFDTNGNYVN